VKPDIKGLTKLAGVLKRTSKKNFNMEAWWEKSKCGTSGCIAGYAAILFPHRFRTVYGYHNEINNVTSYEIEHRRTGHTGEYAFADGFHIPLELASKLTLGSMRATPQQAAKRVMVLVDRLKKSLKK